MKEITADVTISIANSPIQIRITVPNRKTKPDVLLPFLRCVTQEAEDLAVKNLIASGEQVSCAKGCSACCNQLVPVTQLEARHLVALVEGMPSAKRAEYKARFKETHQRLERSGMMDQLMHPERITDNAVELGMRYFRLEVPCPFLENDSCSIHAERPLRCREYLVTNPPANCANPSEDNIQRVEYPVSSSRFLAAFLQPWSKYSNQWVPLSLIFAWTEANPDDSTLRHSRDWIEDALKALSGRAAT